MVYILLGKGFEEAEALVTADVLRRADLPVALTGIGGESVTGSHGIVVRADVPIESVVLKKDDMVVLPGGLGGVASIEGSEAAMALIRQAAASPDYWLAAICAAPTLLARADLLAPDTHAVCYPGMGSELEDAWVILEDQPVVRDGRLITGRGPGAAFDFGLALVEALAGADAARAVKTGLVYGV